MTPKEKELINEVYNKGKNSFKVAEELNVSIRTFFRRKDLMIKKFIRIYELIERGEM